MTQRRTRVTARVEHDRGVFMISVAAELADMHPQTLRMYEQRGLIEPKRSPKGTRLYSLGDVERLRRIQEMTAVLGLNLAGVERVLELEALLAKARRRADQLQHELDVTRTKLDEAERRLKGELVPYRRGEVIPVHRP